MRQFALRVDRLPAWAFIAAAAAVFGAARASRLLALLHQSRGGMELGGIVTLAVFLVVVIFAVRRRHVRAWRSTLDVMGIVVAGNALAILAVWPFIPNGYALSLMPMLGGTVLAGLMTAVLFMPLATAMLWLSRRYGSHSFLTERRVQVVRDALRKRFVRRQPPDA